GAVLEKLEGRILLATHASTFANYLPPQHSLVAVGDYLSLPSAAAPRDVALSYLKAHAAEIGATPDAIDDAEITDRYTDADTGTTHIYLRQRWNGLEISNANININVSV